MALVKRILFALFLSTATYADQIALDSFGYLNNNETSVIIGPSESQDLLNVDVTAGGKSVVKREGYGSYKSLGTGQAIHGGAHFFDASGNDVQLWGSSTSLHGIVTDGTPTKLISTATLNATWDCADTQGFAYCVTSSRNGLIRTNGVTHTYFGTPAGTMIDMTPDRLVISGVSGALSTLYYSKAGDYANFATGIDDPDAFTEVIASPGSRITHVRYACGKLLWWKDRSFGYLLGDNQTNVEPVIVSDTIGTQDNESAIDPGGTVWFRAQDGHIYSYDCQRVEKRSNDISENIQTSGRRTANALVQTSQADFLTGTIVPNATLSATISPGSLVPSSYTVTDTSDADFSSGTLNSTQVTGGTVKLATNNGNFTNPGFESGTTGWDDSGSAYAVVTTASIGCTLNPQAGSNFLFANLINESSIVWKLQLLDATDSTVLLEKSLSTSSSDSCAWVADSLSSQSYRGRRVKLRLLVSNSIIGSSSFTNSSSFIVGGDIDFYRSCQVTGSTRRLAFDSFTGGASSISSGTFTSRTFNVGAAPSYLLPSASWTVNESTPTFVIQHSTSTNGLWSDVGTSTGIVRSVTKQYVRYLSTFTVGATEDASTTLNDVTLLARSSGSYYSVVQAAPNLTSWDTFNATTVNNDGSVTYYVRAATNTFSVQSATPSWVAQSVGSVVSTSTGSFIQIRADFLITHPTQTPTSQDMTVNWFEGSAADKAYATYFEDAIWWAVASGAGQTTNNYIFRYDLLNQGWGIYSFGANGFLIQNNRLYFGSPTESSLYRYGDSTSDNGAAIEAYWKSKDFSGTDPWLENTYKQLDIYAARDQNSTLTVSYAVGTSTTSTSYSVGLSSNTSSIIAHKKLLPFGKNGSTINVKVGDNSASSDWELFGIRFVYDVLSYRPTQ